MKYDTYRLKVHEWILCIASWIFIAGIFSYFFYRSYIAFLVFLLFFPLYFKIVRKNYMKKRKWNLKNQFADALMGISTALQSGNSVENAFRKTYYEMARLHGKDSDIAKEFYVIMKGLENNMTLESLLLDFAERCEVEEIVDFTDIFIVGKRSGGNLRELITNCCNTISEQVQMQREFRIQLSSKQFELRIMGVVPFGIILYIGTSSKGYFDSLYHQMPGIGIMTACLTVYAAAFLWGRKIIENTENK